MRIRFWQVLLLVVVAALASCSKSKFYEYKGPQVTKVEIFKDARVMRLFHGQQLLKQYEVELGFEAKGHKQFEGDGKTPEGRYIIDRRNPESSFYLSLGISYPNARDRAYAEFRGKSPGGDIFIHGQPNLLAPRGPDWTAGCIAVTDDEMREIYAMVKNGTVVELFP